MKYFIVGMELFQQGKLPEEAVKFIEGHGRNVFIVLDESSKIKTNKACKPDKKSKRTRTIHLLNTVGHRCIMTGTLMSKSPVNVVDQMEFLKKGYFEENMFEFENRYVITMQLPGMKFRNIIPEKIWKEINKKLNSIRDKDIREGAVSRYAQRFSMRESHVQRIVDCAEYRPFLNLKDLYNRIKDDIMVVKKKDVLGLPDKVYETIKVDPSDEMLKEYKKLLSSNYLEDFIEDGEEPVTLSGIAKFHRFQDVCNGYIPVPYKDEEDEDKIKFRLEEQKTNPKIEALMDKLDGIDLSTEQVVVWSNRKDFLQKIHEAVEAEGISTCIYDGDTSSEDKEKIAAAFESGEIRVFCGNQASGSHGLDWLKKANTMIFMSNDYSAERREQTEDRIHRGAQTLTKTIIDIVIGGTVDEKIVSSLRLGKDLIHSGQSDSEVYGLFDYEDEEATFVPSANRVTSWVHQDIAAERFWKKKYFGLIFDCGTGKTRTAIKIAEKKGMPVLVIAPKNICSQWVTAIKDNCEVESNVLLLKSDKRKTNKFINALDNFIRRN